jgi:uroporphyrinogen-III synthase
VQPPPSFDALDAALDRLASFDWLALTSVAAVHAVADRLALHGTTIGSAAPALRIGAVGGVSAETARERLGRCDVVPAQQTADGLAAAIPGAWQARVLFPCADRARDALPSGLRARGALVECVVAYRTVKPPRALDELARRAAAGTIDAILLASPSAVDAFAESLGRHAAPPPRLVCIGPATAARCRELGFPVAAVAASPSDDGLVEATCRCLLTYVA